MTQAILPIPAPGAARFGVSGELVWHALAATRAAAVAAARWAGGGDAHAADGAATAAMRTVLDQAPGSGTVVTGEGAKDEAPMLADGERLGRGGRGFDIAVDPLECTDFCARGLPGALATIAVAPPGALWSPGPAYYMDKLVVGTRARAAASLDDEPETIVAQVAAALGKPVGQLRVVVLDKPRHSELIARLRATGACVSTPSAGDVAGALAVLLPDGGADMLLGIGGTPEGVLAACAARALGGDLQGRLAPQRVAARSTPPSPRRSSCSSSTTSSPPTRRSWPPA
jgi:fructose-1,6-bisphosphatase II